MFFDAIAAPLALLSVALPFLFAVTEVPVANVWPLVASWVCGAVLLLLGAGLAHPVGGRRAPDVRWWAMVLAGGLGAAAVVASGIGLVQYGVGDVGWGPWLHASVPGQAVGNLRQRNQQGTLLSLGAWAWLWWVLHVRPLRSTDLGGLSSDAGSPWRWGARAGVTGIAGAAGIGGVAAALALAWLSVGAAATASRTAALQWGLLLGLVALWRGPGRGTALRWAAVAVVLFAVAAWVLPEVLWHWQGVRAEALFHRFADGSRACASRRVLWSNMLTLIAQKPWLGWGWGELDYAHYVTLFPGERFCVLLDNAHNLPLHLAVELGLPVALALCGAAVVLCARARPWRETVPARQLAWGALALIGLHSLLEYPLWYGPFQLVALLSVAILAWPRRGEAWAERAGWAALGAAVAILGVCCLAAWDYHRVGQLYKAAAQRSPAYREDTQAKVSGSVFFSGALDFARLTTAGLTRDNAARMNALARELLHYSPEPRVIELVIESAVMLGQDEEAAFHMKRYRIAYPDDYARWRGAGSAPVAAATTP